ncbi:MAG: LacI family DNA-binding transcriptional regulator, partial [Treponema sp.]|nr:LacI family DNA-binding transcriptional regulator [Treponema sp.]
MKGGKARIGLLLNDTNSDYVKEILDGAYSYCLEKDSSLFVFNIGELNFSYHPFDYQHRVLTQFCNKANIDGLIVCSAVLDLHTEKADFEAFLKTFDTVPIVSIGSKISGRPSILCDPKPGIQKIMEELVDRQKCKRICVLGRIPGSHEAQERTEAIAAFLKKRGIRFDERFIIDGNFTYEGTLRPLENYYDEKGSFDFDAIVALNDDMAFAALDFCARHKIKVPDQVRVTGFDNVPRAEFSHPPLATITQDLYEQGRSAVEAVLNMLQKKRVSGEIFVKTSAILRESCTGHKNLSIAENSDRRVGTEWLEKKNQFYILNDFLISGQARLNLPKMRKYFRDNIERFDVTAAALCIYEQPFYLKDKAEDITLPEKALVLSAFDSSKNYIQNINAEPIPFNPRENMLPPDLLDLSFGKYQIAILSKCENQYGYMVFRCGSCEPLIYSMMAGNFAHLVSEAWESTKAEKAAKVQQERTARLNLISKTDELTGLLYRRGFMELGQQTIDIAVVL